MRLGCFPIATLGGWSYTGPLARALPPLDAAELTFEIEGQCPCLLRGPRWRCRNTREVRATGRHELLLGVTTLR